MQSNNARERDIERRLGRADSPEPPVDLLDRIRGDIPEHLKPVAQAESQGRSRGMGRYRLAAASVLLAVVGGFLAYRVFQDAPEPASTLTAEVRQDAEGERAPTATTEVGLYPQPAGADDGTGQRRTDQRYPLPDPTPTPTLVDQEPKPVAGEQTTTTPDNPESTYAPAEKSELKDPRRAEILPQTPEVAKPKAKQVPTAEEREQLSNLGYLGGTSTDETTYAAGNEAAAAAQAVPPPPAPVSVASEPPIVGRAFRNRQLQEQLKSIEVGAPVARQVPTPSTGGTAEPNDQPWGDMFFRPYGTNPFVDTEDDAQSTFGLDVDTGSYTLTRSYVGRGHLPPPEAIRVEEFVNFFDYRDPAPRHGEFTLTAEGAPSPWQRGPRYQLLRIGVHGREISAAQRKDATLIFVVDVSGSMARENRIELVKRALHLLLGQLGEGDRVGLVVYGSQGRVLLEPSDDLQAVRRAIDRLSTGGSTNAEEGLLLGYQLARRYFRPESINRLVLCSDGVANVGNTGPESILARIGREADEGIELTTVGFGMGNYNDVLMEQLADQGDGNYAYVDTLEEARRIFVENLTGTLQTIASDAKIQVEFDPRMVTRYRLLGYENRDVADHRFRDDTVDAGEIGAGHRVTALYEVKLADDAPRRGALAEIRLRYRSKETGQVVEDSLEVRRAQLAASWQAASPSLHLAALAAELAEILKRSYWAREIRPEQLRERARTVGRESGDDSDAVELVSLAERVSGLVDWTEAVPE